MHKSPAVYEFFRSFFLGNAEAVEPRLDMFCALPVDDANDADELVEIVLGSDADANVLDGLCELLTSIQEFAGVVRVIEAMLPVYERRYGAESKEAGEARRSTSCTSYLMTYGRTWARTDGRGRGRRTWTRSQTVASSSRRRTPPSPSARPPVPPS